MSGLEALGEALRDFLLGHGLPAVTAWSGDRRLKPGAAVAAVSLKALACETPGFQDYLGEEYNEETGLWEERYGKQAKVTFSLDIYGVDAGTVRAGVNTLSLALSRDGPAGLRPLGLTVGETVWQEKAGRYCCPAEAEFGLWLWAVARADGSFSDFEVKGVQT